MAELSQTPGAIYTRKWRLENPEYSRTSGVINSRKWRQENPEKNRASYTKHNEKRRPQTRAYLAEVRAKNRTLVDKLKDAPCLDCGNLFPPECMDFDHVRGQKLINIGQMGSCSEALIVTEIAKCDLVCANCHRIRTRLRQKLTAAAKGNDYGD